VTVRFRAKGMGKWYAVVVTEAVATAGVAPAAVTGATECNKAGSLADTSEVVTSISCAVDTTANYQVVVYVTGMDGQNGCLAEAAVFRPACNSIAIQPVVLDGYVAKFKAGRTGTYAVGVYATALTAGTDPEGKRLSDMTALCAATGARALTGDAQVSWDFSGCAGLATATGTLYLYAYVTRTDPPTSGELAHQWCGTVSAPAIFQRVSNSFATAPTVGTHPAGSANAGVSLSRDGTIVSFKPRVSGYAHVVVVPERVTLEEAAGVEAIRDPERFLRGDSTTAPPLASLGDRFAAKCYKRRVPITADTQADVALTGCGFVVQEFYRAYVYVTDTVDGDDGTISSAVEFPSRTGTQVQLATVNAQSQVAVAAATNNPATCSTSQGVGVDMGATFSVETVNIVGPAGADQADLNIYVTNSVGGGPLVWTKRNCEVCATGVTLSTGLNTITCSGRGRYILVAPRTGGGTVQVCDLTVPGLFADMQAVPGLVQYGAAAVGAGRPMTGLTQGLRKVPVTGASVDAATFSVSAVNPGSYSLCLCPVDESLPAHACSGATHFAHKIGILTVTARADTGKHYVLDATPGAQQSIEITGTNLDVVRDRILIIDCNETCGQASATPAVVEPAVFTALAPRHAAADAPEAGREAVAVDRHAGMFCDGNNVDGSAQGDARPMAHQCHAKCSGGCTGPACFCDGYYEGVDTSTNAALCLPEAECLHMCALLGDACHGVDMHNTLPRCFLNGPGCAAAVADGALVGDATYSYLAQGFAVVDTARSLMHLGTDGLSDSNVLRFAPIAFASGGTYKVCFCGPSEHFGTTCSSTSEFQLEVGRVHVTGVSSLLRNPKLRRQRCYTQFHGGLSCSEGWTVSIVDASAISPHP